MRRRRRLHSPKMSQNCQRKLGRCHKCRCLVRRLLRRVCDALVRHGFFVFRLRRGPTQENDRIVRRARRFLPRSQQRGRSYKEEKRAQLQHRRRAVSHLWEQYVLSSQCSQRGHRSARFSIHRAIAAAVAPGSFSPSWTAGGLSLSPLSLSLSLSLSPFSLSPYFF